MIQTKSVNQAQGFTMLEIVTVLVLLGVIASVAVPKYFDMQELAEIKADKAALAEAQVRINTTFSKKLHQGMECEDAVGEVNQLKLIADSSKDWGSEQYLFNHHLLSGNEILPKGTAVTAVAVDGKYPYTSNLFVPYCSEKKDTDDEGPDDDTDCTFSVGGNKLEFSCFNNGSVCGNEEDGYARWVYGSPVKAENGNIYVIAKSWPCHGLVKDLLSNPDAYTEPAGNSYLIKLLDKLRKYDDFTAGGWNPVLMRGEVYIDKKGNVWMCAGNNISWTNRPDDATDAQIEEGKIGAWIRIRNHEQTGT